MVVARAMACAMRVASQPSTTATAAAAPMVPTVPVVCHIR